MSDRLFSEKCWSDETFLVLRRWLEYIILIFYAMKKFFLFLLVIPVVLVSCSDDDDFPIAEFDVNIVGGVQHDGYLYVKNGDKINVESITLDAKKSTKGAVIVRSNYYWDGIFSGPGYAPTFGREFLIVNQPVGIHTVAIETVVAAEGYSFGYYLMNLRVKVVADDFDMDGLTPDETSVVVIQKKNG